MSNKRSIYDFTVDEMIDIEAKYNTKRSKSSYAYYGREVQTALKKAIEEYLYDIFIPKRYEPTCIEFPLAITKDMGTLIEDNEIGKNLTVDMLFLVTKEVVDKLNETSTTRKLVVKPAVNYVLIDTQL